MQNTICIKVYKKNCAFDENTKIPIPLKVKGDDITSPKNVEMGTVSQGMWVIVEKADKSYFEIKNPVMNSLP